nr:NAD-dependent epimerase/dehydratase family protein [Oscillatoria sp. PCC 10802]
MMHSIVTGCAGFIGSNLCDRLLAEGQQVIGIDCFTDYYPRHIKQANMAQALQHPHFQFINQDILDLNWIELLNGCQVAFHQAAQAGVRSSWGSKFAEYTRNNIEATQVILEAAKDSPSLERLVIASTSSVYGDAETMPTPETACPKPVSPYGITKLAAERLASLYHKNFGVPVVMLRYFTVYGPRQRPEMAFSKFIRAISQQQPIELYGDGEQSRDFTFISDVIEANLKAAQFPNTEGEIFNIGGGCRVSLRDAIEQIAAIIGQPAHYVERQPQAGDARHTSADITKAQKILGYEPQVDLETGLTKQIYSCKNYE